MNNALEKWGNASRCFQMDSLSTLAGAQNIDPMDPLCISLVQEYLGSTKSDLADQFKNKYQPKSGDVTLKEVMSKWKEEQLARGLVYQHLRKVAPSLALEFSKSYPCSSEEVPKQLANLIEEEQLTRCLVFQHLRKVAPALALEFRHNHQCSLETPPERLMKLIEKFNENAQKKVGAVADSGEPPKREKQDQNINNRRLGKKMNTFTTEELVRIKKAIDNKEDIRALAKEMGRSYFSVSKKISYDRTSACAKKGKLTVEEIGRIKQALEQNQDYKIVAKELNRRPNTVKVKMLVMKSNPNPQKARRFSLEEDQVILEMVIPRLKTQELSSSGFLSQTDLVKLATEFHRNYDSVKLRWVEQMQPWLLQHYAGTSGFRIERMLTNLVAQQFQDHRGIDWSEILNQHQEFAGHSNASLGKIFRRCRGSAKQMKKNCDVSLQEVADYASTAYLPGKERRETDAKAAHREKIIQYFKNRVEELGINIVL